jgi:hypothetical protein
MIASEMYLPRNVRQNTYCLEFHDIFMINFYFTNYQEVLMVLNYDFKTQIHTEYPYDKMQIHTDCPSLSSSVCIFALDRYAAESGSSNGQTNLLLTLLRLKLISTLQNYKTSADSRSNILCYI